MKLAPLAFLFAFLTACPPEKPPTPPESPADAGEGEGGASASCSAWCSHARDLGCEAGKPTKGGASCDDVCKNVQSGPARFNLRCRVAARSCPQAETCEH